MDFWREVRILLFAGSTLTNVMHAASSVLDEATSSTWASSVIPEKLFGDCVGILLLSIVEGAFGLGYGRGAGILLRKRRGEGGAGVGWSPPCAMTYNRIGYGFKVGVSKQQAMIFIMDKTTLETFTTDMQVTLGGQAEVTVGYFGRSLHVDGAMSARGFGGVVAVAFTQGLCVGWCLGYGVVSIQTRINDDFYGTECSARDILVQKTAIPESETLQQIYKKLILLEELQNGPSVDTTSAENSPDLEP